MSDINQVINQREFLEGINLFNTSQVGVIEKLYGSFPLHEAKTIVSTFLDETEVKEIIDPDADAVWQTPSGTNKGTYTLELGGRVKIRGADKDRFVVDNHADIQYQLMMRSLNKKFDRFFIERLIGDAKIIDRKAGETEKSAKDDGVLVFPSTGNSLLDQLYKIKTIFDEQEQDVSGTNMPVVIMQSVHEQALKKEGEIMSQDYQRVNNRDTLKINTIFDMRIITLPESYFTTPNYSINDDGSDGPDESADADVSSIYAFVPSAMEVGTTAKARLKYKEDELDKEAMYDGLGVEQNMACGRKNGKGVVVLNVPYNTKYSV